MSYYMGDYYRGDYYQGDPGIGALVKVGTALARRLPTAVSKFIPGLGAASGALSLLRPPRQIALPGPFRMIPSQMLPGGKPGIIREQTLCPAGFHLNKSNTWSHRFGFTPKKTRCVANRSMNPANPRALRRGIRRELGFVALARRTLKGTGITIGRRSFGRKKKFGK